MRLQFWAADTLRFSVTGPEPHRFLNRKFRLTQPNTSLRRKACACAVCSSGFVRSTPS